MKRIIITSAITLAVAAMCAMPAEAKSKKKTVVAEPVVPVVTLNSGSDSISYTCGYQQTNGLVPYLLQQGMDTTYMADFVRGLKEAVSKKNDPSYKAFALGLNIASQIQERMLPGLSNELKDSPDSLVEDMFYEGFYASLANDTSKFTNAAAQQYFQERLTADQEAKKEKLWGANRDAGKKWLADNANKEGVVTLPSGLQYKVLVEGNGPKPKATEEVTVKYEGKLIDGTVFDSSYQRSEQTNKFRANQLIKGWTEALTLMPVGSTWELYIPYELAYGDADHSPIKPYSTLIFKLELVDCESNQPKTVATDVKAKTTATAKAKKQPAKKTAAKK